MRNTRFETRFGVPGVVTVIHPLPLVATSAAVTWAVTRVFDKNVVARGVVPKFTTEVETKPVPFTVSVNAALATAVASGDMLPIEGTGFEVARAPGAPRHKSQTKIVANRAALFLFHGFIIRAPKCGNHSQSASVKIAENAHATAPEKSVGYPIWGAAVELSELSSAIFRTAKWSCSACLRDVRKIICQAIWLAVTLTA